MKPFTDKDLIDIAQTIYKLTKFLAKGRNVLNDLGEEKAKTIVEYEKALARKILEINEKGGFELDGRVYPKPPSNAISTVAKGLVADKEGFLKELAEIKYKTAIANMDSLKAEINALQSINKYHVEI